MDANTTALPTQADFKEIVSRAANGDKEGRAALRTFLDSHPELWQEVGRLAIETELVLVNQIAGNDPLVEESVLRTLRQMRSDLSGDSLTPLEKIAIERVVATWLAVQVADKALAANSSGTLPNAHYLLKRQDLAQRHHATAVRSLQEIRRLLPKSKQPRPATTTETHPELHIFVAPDDAGVKPSTGRATGTA